jgi:hypothetical protein
MTFFYGIIAILWFVETFLHLFRLAKVYIAYICNNI